MPTQIVHDGEYYLKPFKMYVSGFESSPYGIEWMRFEEGSPIPEIIRTVAHLAFEVDNLEEALQAKEILTPPNSPSDGVMVAMIIQNGAPIELHQFGGQLA